MRYKPSVIALASLVMVAMVFMVVHVLVVNGPAVDVARVFVTEDSATFERIGTVQASSVPLFGYSFTVRGQSGKATLSLRLDGSRRSARAFLEMEKSMGTWTVTRSRLEQR